MSLYDKKVSSVSIILKAKYTLFFRIFATFNRNTIIYYHHHHKIHQEKN